MAGEQSLGRPDLEEFLSALHGFVDRKSGAVSDESSYLKFLDIFCRSVGSGEGHLLRPDAAGRLESVASFGVEPSFGADFNASRNGGGSPLDSAYTQQRVVAIVEIRQSDVPGWFFSLMERHGYKSLVAVPIVGPSGPTGLLCAYYRDVCLFDQGTLDRLATVGRMLGGTENAPPPKTGRPAAPPATPAKPTAAGDGDPYIDRLATGFTEKSFTKVQVFAEAVKTAGHVLAGASIVCGPIRLVSSDMVLAIADGDGIPQSAISHRVVLSQAIRSRLERPSGPSPLAGGDQGEL